ncbi:MAG: MFS transporter [Corallococcus sp.]|nr:MFS transporter [Corallococcus sp.]
MSEKALKTQLSAEDRQFNKNKWLFSISGIGRDMSYQLISSFLLIYIQFGVTLNVAEFTTISMIIGIGGRIWDAINDPMMGAIIEGTHMKFGKFKPWILIGAVTCGSVIIAMFNIQGLAHWNFVVFMSVMYLLWETTFTMNDIGYWSMLASLSSKKEQRNSVTMLTVVFAGIGAFVAQGGISFLYPGNVRDAFRWISVGVVAVFVVMQVICAVFVKERPRTQMEQSEKVSLKRMWNTIKKNDQVLWMTLSMLFYNIGSSLLVGLAYNLYYIEIGYNGETIVFIAIFGIVNVATQALYPMLSRKLGRRKLQLISIIAACVGYVGIALLGWGGVIPFNLITLSVFGILVFAGQALYYMTCIINMTNCVEYNEYKYGERNEAVVSTLRPFMAKFADAIKMGIVTLVLVVSGVFLLSNNISTIEAQRDYFAKNMDGAARVEYVTSLQDYLKRLPDKDAANYDELMNRLNEDLQKDQTLAQYQIEVNYLEAVSQLRVLDAEGNIVGTIADVNAAMFGSGNYSLSISGDGYNVADDNFLSKGNTSMRLWLRASVTVVPIIMIAISLIIQRKKFIIDENKYDEMLEEIERKKLLAAESPEQTVVYTESSADRASEDTAQTEQTVNRDGSDAKQDENGEP